ncbi:MAG: oxygen-independent coproporphyrinogen III oxidase [Gemmatimonadetes bacterium]|nr:oxygen-independent coproporphyrinogen III oxidase [Gemmatimonadota bacterium]
MKDAPLDATRIAELIGKYDRPGPRYTSYPTAVEFSEETGADAYERHLGEAAESTEPLSLYLHLPFCEHRCTFCGCNVVISPKHEPSVKYLETLHREIDLIADRLGGRTSIRQLHWGGGTPTFQTPEEMEALFAKITSRFRIEDGAEVALEVDPRVTTSAHLRTLRDLGFNRLSMGVQDFTPEVQEAISRNQTWEQTESLVAECRELGFRSLNVDLVYGLPLQTPGTFQESLKKVLRLRPERVAVYSYAHVPWLKANQRKTDTDFLPSAETKIRLFAETMEAFTAAGYDPIGMDHFALPDDELAVAARAGTLHRNFMGYTTRPAPDMVGLGVSSIGDVGNAHFQNQKVIPKWKAAVESGTVPVFRGVVLTDEDCLRRRVIHDLMCNWRVDKGAVESAFGISFDSHFARELGELAPAVDEGFVETDAAEIRVVGVGRLFVRNVAMVFDEYLRRMQKDGPVFSRTV